MLYLTAVCVCVCVCVLSADRVDDGDSLPHPALHSGVHDAAGLAVCLHRFGGPLRDDGGDAVLMEKVKSCSASFQLRITAVTTHYQCWGKLLLKVMHYNIALLPKKVTNYIT